MNYSGIKIGRLVKMIDHSLFENDRNKLKGKVGIVIDIQDGQRVYVLFGENLAWCWNYDLRII